ncbi:MAG TPA: sugar phosphate nucleotidyltransferase, partial [Anaerolineales bacterium]
MYPSEDVPTQELKVVILAAGKESVTSGVKPILLQNLGDRKVVDYVVQNAIQLTSPYDLFIVVGYQQDEMRLHLGAGYQYITQVEQLGTGHAVLQLKPLLEDFKGDLLILYGDTPLFRPDSIRGLLNRHRLRRAHLTLLTAIVDQPHPYGRIIRDSAGQIMDIIEAAEASQVVQEIRELNVGAYVVRADAIFSALKKLSPSPLDGTYRLTDCVHQLIRSGLRVESYSIYDPDEVQGINTAEDLAQAEFILQKRLFRPHRPEEENKVAFGTGGWRAVISQTTLAINGTADATGGFKSWRLAFGLGSDPGEPVHVANAKVAARTASFGTDSN